MDMRRPNYATASTHKECAYFNSGICVLSNIPVNPNQIACPNFTPKHLTANPQAYTRNLATGAVGRYRRGDRRSGAAPKLKEKEIEQLEQQITQLQKQLERLKEKMRSTQ